MKTLSLIRILVKVFSYNFMFSVFSSKHRHYERRLRDYFKRLFVLGFVSDVRKKDIDKISERLSRNLIKSKYESSLLKKCIENISYFDSDKIVTLYDYLKENNRYLDDSREFKSYLLNHIKSDKRKLIIDITIFYRMDAGTGIQRVVRCVLEDLLKNPPIGFEICPVYIENHQFYVAHSLLAEKYNYEATREYGIKNMPLIPSKNDVYLGIDLNPDAPQDKNLFDLLHLCGVKIYFFIHDLLPVQMPHFFSDPNIQERFNSWLGLLSEYDGMVANSKAVENDYRAWRESHEQYKGKPFSYGFSHLGADFINECVSGESLFPNDADEILSAFSKRPTVILVSTIEPRKGHVQTLHAFEKLWASDFDCNLAFAGKRGWLMDDFFKILENHPERNKRLFELGFCSNYNLQRFYQVSTGVIMPSEGEGFGLAVIEGAHYRKPLLLRDIPVFREIAGNNATYFSGSDSQSLAVAVKDWLDEIKKGTNPKSEFIHSSTWSECTDNILRAINISPNQRFR